MTAEAGRGDASTAERSGLAGESPAAAGGPRRIVVAGDWHGNEEWAVSVIRRIPTLLAGEDQRLILHLGDFGIWPGQAGQVYLDRVSHALAEADAELWFVDGNHEDFARLDADMVLACVRVRAWYDRLIARPARRAAQAPQPATGEAAR